MNNLLKGLLLFTFCVLFVHAAFSAIVGMVEFCKPRPSYLWKDVKKINGKYYVDGYRIKVGVNR
jgi:hypothetical protein